MEILISDKSELHSTALKLMNYTGDKRILAFYGSMGAGKTTLIKSVCDVLGTVDVVTSPTFTLVNEYKTSSGGSIFHFDFYRIKKIEEVFDFGIEEYFASGAYCLMEWPELVEDILPDETFRVRIEVDEKERRILHFS